MNTNRAHNLETAVHTMRNHALATGAVSEAHLKIEIFVCEKSVVPAPDQVEGRLQQGPSRFVIPAKADLPVIPTKVELPVLPAKTELSVIPAMMELSVIPAKAGIQEFSTP